MKTYILEVYKMDEEFHFYMAKSDGVGYSFIEITSPPFPVDHVNPSQPARLDITYFINLYKLAAGSSMERSLLRIASVNKNFNRQLEFKLIEINQYGQRVLAHINGAANGATQVETLLFEYSIYHTVTAWQDFKGTYNIYCRKNDNRVDLTINQGAVTHITGADKGYVIKPETLNSGNDAIHVNMNCINFDPPNPNGNPYHFVYEIYKMLDGHKIPLTSFATGDSVHASATTTVGTIYENTYNFFY